MPSSSHVWSPATSPYATQIARTFLSPGKVHDLMKPFITRTDPWEYVLMVPSVLEADTSNQACVQLQNLNEPVTLTIALDYNMDHYDLWKGPVAEKHFSQCINFTVKSLNSRLCHSLLQ
ncbi:UNVERIFIED_CONTAM: hypothetical protein K2H54_013285 [Gekko kuhli]